MSDELLTREEYAAIAAELTPPAGAFINGAFRGAGEMGEAPSINPATGHTIARVAMAGRETVDFAVGKAREAFEDGRWSRLHPAERKKTLIHFAKLVERNRHELAVLESLDSGKPIRDCATIDLPETIATLKWHAEAVDKLYDQVSPSGEDALGLIVREPIGVVGLVLPWNCPLLMLAWKIAPALAVGCSVVVKPAEQTPLTALRLAELAQAAGLPRGVFNVVPGDGPNAGEPLGLHMDVDMVSFTGSTETGKRFLRYAADSNLKKIALECGGKNPAIVFEDAEDLDLVAEHVTNAAFWNMGENCSAASRLIVHKAVKQPLLERILARARDWRVGDPLDPATRLGPLIDAEHFRKVCDYLEQGRAVATALIGGVGENGFAPATIFEGAPADAAINRDEIFGPVLSVIEVESAEQAIATANDTPYGLAASLFSANGKTALRAARSLRAGTVAVNCYVEGDLSTPFGGYKQSGFWGRDKGVHAHEQYTETKSIWVDLADRSGETVA